MPPSNAATWLVQQAAREGDIPAFLAALEQIKAPPLPPEDAATFDYDGHYGYVALGVAAGAGQVEFVRFLLERGVDPGSASHGIPWSPLMQAARGGHVEVARLLLAAGANVSYCETRDFGLTALDVAEQGGQVAMRGLLLQAGAEHFRK